MAAADDVKAIRAAATVNAAALTSVAAEIDNQLALVLTFPNTPAKGQLRDALARIQQRYKASSTLNLRLVDLTNVVLDMMGENSPPGGDPPPVPTTWSTGEW